MVIFFTVKSALETEQNINDSFIFMDLPWAYRFFFVFYIVLHKTVIYVKAFYFKYFLAVLKMPAHNFASKIPRETLKVT